MSVDLSIEDVSLDKTLLCCQNAYVYSFRALVHPFLPEKRAWLAFQEHYSAYVNHAYWGVEEEPINSDDLHLAGDLVEEFEFLLMALRALKGSGVENLSHNENRALRIFSEDQLEFMRDHCRDNPESRILVSLC